MRLIDADALYKAMQDAEDLARKRVLDDEAMFPTGITPAYMRYVAQLDERIRAKRMVADAPTVDAVPVVRCKDCKLYCYNGYAFGRPVKQCSVTGFEDCEDDDFCSRGERRET